MVTRLSYVSLAVTLYSSDVTNYRPTAAQQPVGPPPTFELMETNVDSDTIPSQTNIALSKLLVASFAINM